jgi:hypothetical protein
MGGNLSNHGPMATEVLARRGMAGPIRLRLEQLAALPGWRQSPAALSPAREPGEARRRLAELVEVATLRHQPPVTLRAVREEAGVPS